MGDLARLEAALQEPRGMSYDNLVVYADLLQGVGDVRGELIALDLVAPANRYAVGATAWRERRGAVLAAWLGATLADEVADQLDLGFVKELDERCSLALLASPAGAYVRAFSLDVARTTRAAAVVHLAALASRPRPWLQRLAITGARADRAPLVDDALADALIAATPRLSHLAIAGAGVVTRFPHPTLRYLCVDPPAALGALVDAARMHPLPAVVQLELQVEAELLADALDALDVTDVPDVPAEDAPSACPLTATLLPALYALDLRRNVGADQPRLFDRVRAWPVCAQVRLLDLPPLASDDAVHAAARLLDAMPAVEDVRVARTYGAPVFGEALRARRPPVAIPLAFPWPRPASLQAYNSLVVRIPDETYDDIIALPSLLAFLEREFEAFAPEAREAWTRMWDALRPGGAAPDIDDEAAADAWGQPPDPGSVPLGVVARAIDACDALTTVESRSWAEFRAHFRHAARGLAVDAPIALSIYRRGSGW